MPEAVRGRYFASDQFVSAVAGVGTLLASAALAYAERQFTLLGPWWSWHLLLLAVVHAAVAYAFSSPLVLAAQWLARTVFGAPLVGGPATARSMIAVTPWPPAAQIEISPRP